MKSFTCGSCGSLPYALVDGYPFGERVLEGVKFQLRIKNAKLVASVDPSAKEYMETLDEKRWIKEAEEFAQNTDTLSCPKCGSDIDNVKEIAPKVIGKKLKASTFEEIMEEINNKVGRKVFSLTNIDRVMDEVNKRKDG